MTNPSATSTEDKLLKPSGLGLWNLYFILKLLLLTQGYLNVQVIPNVIFIACLLIPMGATARLIRTLVAIPIGVALFYHDTWLPPFSRLLNQPGVLDFSWLYLFEIVERTIDWQMLGLLLVAIIAYAYLHVWVRLTTLTLAGFAWLLVQQFSPFAFTPVQGIQPVRDVAVLEAGGEAAEQPLSTSIDTAFLNQYLDNFYAQERKKKLVFNNPQDKSFDVLFINICSLAWDDLQTVGLHEHALFKQMDLMFDNFNSATSYSGPAVKRLLSSCCGQPSHKELYDDSQPSTLLMSQLDALGFEAQGLLNHTGEFDGFKDILYKDNQLIRPDIGFNTLQRTIIGFDGTPVWNDLDVLTRWWQTRLQNDNDSVALFYNTITLHDGNRIALPNGGSRRGDYRELASNMLAELTAFVQQLEASGRPIMVIFVPEHGASLHGDLMQIAGMREIPSTAITYVPVGVKFINIDTQVTDTLPIRVKQPSSYFALGELLNHYLNAPTEQALDLNSIAAQLSPTDWVAEYDDTVVLQYQGQSYIRIRHDGPWLPYPER